LTEFKLCENYPSRAQHVSHVQGH